MTFIKNVEGRISLFNLSGSSVIAKRESARLFSHPLLVYFIVALIFLGPALGKGYLLTLDMVFTPSMSFSSQVYGLNQNTWASLPYLVVLQSANALLPGWMVQKLAIIVPLAMAGWGTHRLVQGGPVSSYYAGLLYMINPYTVVRLIAGQWTLLAAYAVIPFAVSSLIEFFEVRSKKSAIKVALLWTLGGVFQLHGFVLIGLAFLIIGIGQFLRTPHKVSFAIALARPALIAGVAFGALNFYWLTRVFMDGVDRISRISDQAIELFSPASTSGLAVEFDVASMQGFWRAGLISQNTDDYWGFVFMGVLFLTLVGLFAGVRTGWSHRELTFASVGIVGFLLALGISSPMSAPLFEVITSVVPLMRGFRDTHKFVALLILAYVYLGSLGIEDIFRYFALRPHQLHMQKVKNRVGHLGYLMLLIPLLIPLIYGISSFGFAGQVRPTDFPSEWYEANRYISQTDSDSSILVLPWHQYMDFHWLPQSQRRLSNPSRLFFDNPVIAGDNLEIGNVFSESVDPVSEYVELLLAERDSLSNLGALLVPLDAQFVLLLKDADFNTYSFLEKQSDLQLVLSNEELMLFENTWPTERAFRVPTEEIDQFPIDSIGDVRLPLVSKLGYPFSPLVVESISPIKFLYEAPDGGLLGLSVSQGSDITGWKVDDHEPIGYYLGFIPVYSAEISGTAEKAKLFRDIIISYAVSFLALVSCLGVLATDGWNRRHRRTSNTDY